MVVNLQHASPSGPEQIIAGDQGDDLETVTQSALAGTLVSSLHRLKDIDNLGELPRRTMDEETSLMSL